MRDRFTATGGSKILVVGAGPAQAPAILRAAALGYRVLASDRDPRAPGFAGAAESAAIDVTDEKGNLEWASREGVAGVTSYATDAALRTVAAVREALGLPGLARRAVEAGLDKVLQRTLLASAGVPQPEFEVYSGPDAAGRCLERWGEAVVKPAGGSGSRGVSLARSPEELSRAIGRAELAAEGGKVLLERRLAGRELSVETFSAGGRHRVLAVGERIFSPGLFAVASEIRYPAPVGEAERRAVERVAEAVLDALGVDHSPGHIEIMLAPDGPSVVEAGVRGGGFFIFSTIVGAVSGYDIVENWTRLCAGDPVEPVPERPARLGAVLRYLHAGAGVVESVHGLEEARAVPGLLSCGAFVGPGDRVGPIEKDGDRSGWLIASGRDLDEALLRADEAGSRIGFRVRPC